MKLPAAGVEYVTFTATADFALDGSLEAFLSNDPGYPAVDAVWTAATWLDVETVAGEVHTRQFQLLCAGSEVTPVPGGAVGCEAGTNYVFIRISDSPEVIIRPAGRFEAL